MFVLNLSLSFFFCTERKDLLIRLWLFGFVQVSTVVPEDSSASSGNQNQVSPVGSQTQGSFPCWLPLLI